MRGIAPLVLNHLKEICKPGTRIKLIEMHDPYRKIDAGMIGTVKLVDDIGTVHVNWENGSTLGLVYGEDKYEILSEVSA